MTEAKQTVSDIQKFDLRDSFRFNGVGFLSFNVFAEQIWFPLLRFNITGPDTVMCVEPHVFCWISNKLSTVTY